MATYDDLCAAVEACALPFARIQFDPHDPDGLPECPFVVLMPQRTQNRMGSNAIAAELCPYDVELYTEGSDMALEQRLGAALAERGLAWQRSHLALEDGVCETVWSVFCAG